MRQFAIKSEVLMSRYVYQPGMPQFHIVEEDLKMFHDFNSRNKENRRLRMLFLLQNYNLEIHPDIKYLQDLYRSVSLTEEYFAKCLSEGYAKLSVIIKGICHGVGYAGNYSEHLTDDPWINYSIVNNKSVN